MPITRKAPTTGGQYIPPPFVGPVDHRVAVPLNLTTLVPTDLDANGYLKPMLPLRRTGPAAYAKISAPAQVIKGVTMDYVKVADNNLAGTIAALGTIDVVIAFLCAINRAAAEDILERAYSADELAAFEAAGCRVELLF